MKGGFVCIVALVYKIKEQPVSVFKRSPIEVPVG